MADLKISDLTAAGALTGVEQVELVQTGNSHRTTTQDIANLAPVVTDHGLLGGLADDDHTQYHTDARGDARYPPNARNIIAGAGLSGGGTLAADRTINVGAGTGIAVAADAVGLDTANARNVDHSGISILSGAGLEGGGDITATRTLSIADAAVALTKLVNIATASILGRVTGGAGSPEVLTATQATALLNVFTTALKGLVPPSGGGTANYLRADGSWAPPPGAGTSDHGALTGLGDDDHTQYHNDTRGDVRYYTKTLLDSGQLDTRYYTEAEVLAAFAAIVHTHPSTQINDSSVAGRNMLTAADVAAQTALLNNFTSVLKGLAPPSGGGTTNYLRADGTWAAPPGTTTGAHGTLTGLGNDDHTQYHNNARGDARYPPNTRSISAGAGLSGGGNLSADRSLQLDTANSRNVDHAAVQITTAGGLQGGGTIEATRTLSIQDNGVSRAHLADMAQNRVLGRISTGAGDPEDLTMTQLTGLLNLFGVSTQGVAPPSGGGTSNYLRADGSWAVPPGTVPDGDKGDVTVSGGGGVWTIDNDAVTYAKMQNVANNNRLLGRISGAGGDPEELTGTQVTALLDAVTSGAKGLAPASGGGTTNFLRADGTWAAPPGASFSPANCYRYNGATQSIPHGAFTSITVFNTSSVDQGGWVAAGTNNTRLYIPATGIYEIDAIATLDLDTHALMRIRLTQDGSPIQPTAYNAVIFAASVNYCSVRVTRIASLTAGSFLEAQVFFERTTGGGTAAATLPTNSSSFSAKRIG